SKMGYGGRSASVDADGYEHVEEVAIIARMHQRILQARKCHFDIACLLQSCIRMGSLFQPEQRRRAKSGEHQSAAHHNLRNINGAWYVVVLGPSAIGKRCSKGKDAADVTGSPANG